LLKDLILNTPVASLATLHQGEPAASMVPYAVLASTGDVVIHVSRLAAHTQDMERHANVAVLITATLTAQQSALSLPRVSMQGVARRCDPAEPHYAAARESYLRKLPDAQELFTFTDFSLWLITPQHLRYVAGFGRAQAVSVQAYQELLQPA
jgi:putative heme iron utilization protein